MIQGLGLGLRFKYIESLATELHPVQWLELLLDHFHSFEATPVLAKVDQLLERYPCVIHGVNMSLASSDPLNADYLKLLAWQVERFNPVWISDHLCFSHVGNIFLHELLPIPFTHALLDQIAFKIDLLQQKFKRPFLIENISSYLRLQGSEMSEAEFIAALTDKTGCGILLDLNNVAVSCHNHQESLTAFITALPFDRVLQIHMAGATMQNHLRIDTHSQAISPDVLTLYQQVIEQHGPIPTCLEWDNDLPEFSVLLHELERCNNVSA